MTLRTFALAAGRRIKGAARWLAWSSGQVITSLENRIDRNDVKTLATKFVPRVVAVYAPAEAAKSVVHETLRTIVIETFVDEQVIMAAFALVGATVWSFAEAMSRKKGAPTEPVPPPTAPAP